MTPHLADTPILKTDRLVLRAPEAADASPILAFLGTERAVFYGGPLDSGAAWRKFASYVGQWVLRGYGMFTVTHRDGGAVVGLAGPVHPPDFPEPEMSWLVTDARFEGIGFAREACDAVLSHLFRDLGWTTAVSYIDSANHRSLALAYRLGARHDPASASPLPGCETYRHRTAGAAV